MTVGIWLWQEPQILQLNGDLVLDISFWQFKSHKMTKEKVLGLYFFCFCHNLHVLKCSSLYLRRAEKHRMYSVIQRSSPGVSGDCFTAFSRSADRARRRSRLELRLLDPLWIWKRRAERWSCGICVLLLMSVACWVAQLHYSGVLWSRTGRLFIILITSLSNSLHFRIFKNTVYYMLKHKSDDGTSVCLSVQSWWVVWISLVLIAGWLFARGGLRPELFWRPSSERGVRRRWRGLAPGFPGSPSEDPVSAGLLSVSVSSEGRRLSGTGGVASSTPFSTPETQNKRFYFLEETFSSELILDMCGYI